MIFCDQIFIIMMLPGIEMLRLFVSRIIKKEIHLNPIEIIYIMFYRQNKTNILLFILFPFILYASRDDYFRNIDSINFVYFSYILYFLIKL